MRREEQLTELPEGGTKREARHKEHGGSAQGATERASEVRVGHYPGRDGVHGAVQLLCLYGVAYETDDVVHVDPRHPLASMAKAASHAHFEGQEHLVERAAIGRKNDADPKRDDSNSKRSCCVSLLFPGDADVALEAGPGARGLPELFVSPIPIEANG